MDRSPFTLFARLVILTGLLALTSLRAPAEEPQPWGNTIPAAEIDEVMTAMASSGLETGEPAPNEEVISLQTGDLLSLSSLWKERPVVLFFGSASCSFNVENAAAVAALHGKFGKATDFAWIYLREAHPDDSTEIRDPSEVEKRRLQLARKFQTEAGIPFPVYIDRFGDPVAKKYAAWPTRIYVILQGGEVGFSGAVGPWGFRPLRITPNWEPDYHEQKPFVPRRHERPNLESYLERICRKEIPILDSYVGKPVLTSRNAIGLITSRLENCPLVGEPAIELELVSAETGAKVSLQNYWEKKPIVLSMGSLSAEELTAATGALERLHKKHGDEYQFLHIYIRESSGLRIGGDPVGLSGRRSLAERWAEENGISFPVLVDTMDDSAAVHYSAWPSRLIVIGSDGRIRYRGYQSPWGLKVSENGRFVAPEWDYPLSVRQKDVISLEEFLRKDSENSQ